MNILFSYVPFFDYAKHVNGSMQAAIQDFRKHVENIDCNARAAMWFTTEDMKHLGVTLLVPRAAALVEHMKSWAEGDIESWFEVHVGYENNQQDYYVAVIPNLKMSYGRSASSWKDLASSQPHPAPTDKISLIFLPISFHSTSGKIQAFNNVRSSFCQPSEGITVDFLDADLVDSDNPPSNDQLHEICKKAVKVGNLKLIVKDH